MNTDSPDETPTLEDLRFQLAQTNAKFPERLTAIDPAVWPEQEMGRLQGMWRSQTHVVRLVRAGTAMILEIQRAQLNEQMEFVSNEITWAEIMQVLAELGYHETWAVEVFPPHEHVLHEITSRHIWLLEAQPEFGWRVKRAQAKTTNGHSFEVVDGKCDQAPASVIEALAGRARFMN